MRNHLRHTVRRFYFCFALTALLAPAVLADEQPASQPSAETQSDKKAAGSDAAAPNALEQEFVTRINSDRKTRGLHSLQIDPLLTNIAREHSREMCEKNYFDHHSPTAGMASPLDRFISRLTSCGRPAPEYALIGENIYYSSTMNQAYSVGYAHQSLMKSPHHRKNILEPRYEKIGVGTYRNAAGEFWVTEIFLRDEPEKAPEYNPALAQSSGHDADPASSVAAEPEP